MQTDERKDSDSFRLEHEISGYDAYAFTCVYVANVLEILIVAEQSYLQLRSIATTYPEYHYIAISHSSSASTSKWLDSINQSHPSSSTSSGIEIIIDESREIYAKWGLGVASFWHVLNPSSMWEAWKLGREKGIWNRPTESGSRWQIGGSFAVEEEGEVVWVEVDRRAGKEVEFGGAVEALGGG